MRGPCHPPPSSPVSRGAQSDNGYDCPGGWLPNGGSFSADPSKKGSGYYPAGIAALAAVTTAPLPLTANANANATVATAVVRTRAVPKALVPHRQATLMPTRRGAEAPDAISQTTRRQSTRRMRTTPRLAWLEAKPRRIHAHTTFVMTLCRS